MDGNRRKCECALADVEALKLAPGEVLVLKARQVLSAAQFHNVRESLESLGLGNRVIVVDHSFDLAVLPAEEAGCHAR